ncbi:MAG: glycosyl hydrolase 2 galactose-binding domain-containing protein [Flavobacteriales bacterium]
MLHENWTLRAGNGTLESAIPAQVPGHVQLDLERAGKAPEAYLGTNEPKVQWVEETPWVYSCSFQRPAEWRESDSTTIRFSGLDTYAEVWLDGILVLTADNAHIPWVLPNFLAGDAEHHLELHFAPVAQVGQQRLEASPHVLPCSNEPRPIGRQTSPYTRKALYQFGWDWGPRLASPGIPGAVEWLNLSMGEPSAPLFSPSCEVLDTLGRVLVHNMQGWSLNQVHPGAWSMIGDTLCIENPQLWWPNGMGQQPQYHLNWRHNASGHEVESSLGLRTIEWAKEPDAYGPQFSLHVNGVPVHARGANIIPGDFFISRADSLWPQLVGEAARAHMNMLRVWGGGVYPPEAFFNACDSAGILVWQDFMFACAMVPGDDPFRDQISTEATHHIQRLRNHPSLALWCGNNEVERAWKTWGWQDLYDLHGPDSASVWRDYSAWFESELPGLVAQYGHSDYWPSSPHRTSDGGDEHAWGVWFGLEDFSYFSEHPGRFVSEYGLQSLPNLHTLQAAGITSFQDSALQYRQRSRMDWLKPGFDGWDMMEHFMSKTTGPPKQGDLEDWIFKTQVTQAEGLRQALERHRTSNGRYAGSLFWSLNDVWPAVSWSTIDYAGRWKLGHYAARRANQPQTVIWKRTRQDSMVFQVFNDRESTWTGEVTLELRDFQGRVKKSQQAHFNLPKHTSQLLNLGPRWAWDTHPKESALAWTWTPVDSSQQPVHSAALWVPPVEAKLPSKFEVQINPCPGGLILKVEGYSPAVQLTASVPGHFSENGFAVWPGDSLFVGFEAENPSVESKDVRYAVKGLASP